MSQHSFEAIAYVQGVSTGIAIGVIALAVFGPVAALAVMVAGVLAAIVAYAFEKRWSS